MIQEVKAYRTSSGVLYDCKAMAARHELSLLLRLDDFDLLNTLIENDDKVIALLQEHRKAQPTVRNPRRAS